METMKITLKEPLDCIKQPGLKDFYLEYRNGIWVVVSGTFSQSIKQSEYEQILANRVGVEADEAQAESIHEVNEKSVEEKIAEQEGVSVDRQTPQSNFGDRVKSNKGRKGIKK